jgi:type IV secretory pathway component VirB8
LAARFFLLIALAFILFVNFFFIILTVAMIRIEMVIPVVELVHHIMHNKITDKFKLQKFISTIQRIEYDESIYKEGLKGKRRDKIEK